MLSKSLLASAAAAAALLSAVAAHGAQSGYYSGGQSKDDTLPPDFRGRITYQGTHEGSVTRAAPPLRSLRTRDILRSATGGRTQQRGGALNLEVTFNGSAVTVRYSGTGMNTGTMTGTRSGGRCRLMDHTGGDWLEAECTRTRFSSSSRGQLGRETITVRFEATATRIVDAETEERERQASISAARAESERASAARPRPEAAPRTANNAPPSSQPPRPSAPVRPAGGVNWVREVYSPRPENVINAPSCVVVNRHETGIARYRHENTANFWYEDREVTTRPPMIQNRCNANLEFEITWARGGMERFILDQGREAAWSDLNRYRYIGPTSR